MTKIIKKHFYLIGPGGIFLLLEVLLAQPFLVWFIFVLSVLGLIFSFWLLSGPKIKKDFFLFLISPVLFYIASFLFLIFLIPQINVFFKHGFILFISLVLGILYFIICQSAHNPEEHYLKVLSVLFEYLNLFTTIFSFSFFYNLVFFLNAPFWFVQFLTGVLMIILFYQIFWSNQFIAKKNIVFLPVMALVFMELFWAIGLWPINFYSRGLIMGIFYYLFSGLVRNHFSENLRKKIVQKYLAISFISLLIILLTSHWL